MNRTVSVLLAVAMVLSVIGAVPITLAQDDEPSTDPDEIEPGEQLTGVIGVQDAEFDGEIAERTFGIKVAQAASDDARADVVGEQLTDVEQRIGELEQRLDELEAARDRGEISEGQYQAQVAKVAAEKATAERLAGQSETVASGLPADILAERGINVSAIQELRERANELGGPHVAEIARSIAGPDVGKQITSGAQDRIPTDRIPGGTPGDVTSDDDDEPAHDTVDDAIPEDADTNSSELANNRPGNGVP